MARTQTTTTAEAEKAPEVEAASTPAEISVSTEDQAEGGEPTLTGPAAEAPPADAEAHAASVVEPESEETAPTLADDVEDEFELASGIEMFARPTLTDEQRAALEAPIEVRVSELVNFCRAEAARLEVAPELVASEIGEQFYRALHG